MYVSSKFRQGIMRPRQRKPVRHEIATRGGRVKRIKIAAGMGLGLAILCGGEARAQKPPLLPEKDVAALANEVSGETAKRNLEGIARFHRQRGSKGFHEAAELVAERLRAYGLSDVAILQFPADGKVFYGTQRSRPAWDAESAQLIEWDEDQNGVQKCLDGLAKARAIGTCVSLRPERLSFYESEPVVLAEDSESAEAKGGLVDVGEGTKDSDYENKPVKGNFVLVSAQPGAVQDLAVGKYGAVGIISYAQNQKTAWWGEDENLIRWGHLETFSPNKTFAFMVSLKTAHTLQEKLAKNDLRYMVASVKAGQHSGSYVIATAVIAGADPNLKDEEIVFSCHLDHERPGANDNASGCAAILEVARTLQKLTGESQSGGCTPIDFSGADKKIQEDLAGLERCHWLITPGNLARPARTIRFVFPPEIEGTMALVNSPVTPFLETTPTEVGKDFPKLDVNRLIDGKPLSHRFKAVIHMDMVGGGPETKAVFHVTRGPMSLPSFVHDVAWAFADWVNEESYKFAATGKADYPMVAPEGGKEPLRAEYSAFTMGSDHDVYQDSSFGIPAIYLNDWPDRYIHTNFDSAANIDPTKLKRAAFIGAASGYFLAGPKESIPAISLLRMMTAGQTAREILRVNRESDLGENDQAMEMPICAYEKRIEEKVFSQLRYYDSTFEGNLTTQRKCKALAMNAQGLGNSIFVRKKEPKGPLAVFGYDYFSEHAKAAGIATPKLLSYEGLWGAGEEYAYEVLNFADGKRNSQEIRDAVSAEYGPVPLELVVEYLKALEKIGVVAMVK